MQGIKTKSNKNSRLIIILIIVVVVGTIFVPMLMMKKSISYTEEKAYKGNIDTYYTFSGNISSKNALDILATEGMEISEVKFEEGEKVQKDDIIFINSGNVEIKAKKPGTITLLNVEEGDIVVPGTLLCKTVDFENMELKVKVSEYDLNSIEEGQDVTVYISAKDQELRGEVSKISETANIINGAVYYTTTIDIFDAEDLKTGMSAEINILNKNIKDAVLISMEMIKFDENDKPYVYIKNEDANKNPVKKYIQVGINDGIRVEIEDGVSEGDILVIRNEDADDGGPLSKLMPPMPPFGN
jgi:multidrug efflux pump subunit AcrA (membrane-fusion protein)